MNTKLITLIAGASFLVSCKDSEVESDSKKDSAVEISREDYADTFGKLNLQKFTITGSIDEQKAAKMINKAIADSGIDVSGGADARTLGIGLDFKDNGNFAVIAISVAVLEDFSVKVNEEPRVYRTYSWYQGRHGAGPTDSAIVGVESYLKELLGLLSKDMQKK